jgi:RNA polymerase sigma-70 factor (ECF subfamily)
MIASGGETDRQQRFQALLAPMHQRLYRYIRHSLRNVHDAEDVSQEVLARAWTHFEAFDARRSFDAWVFRIARNLIVDQQRRKRRRPEIPLDTPSLHNEAKEGDYHQALLDTKGDPETYLMAQEISEEIEKAVRSLTPAHRTVLRLMEQHQSYEYISRVLDCPMGTVRSRVHRARERLRHQLQARLPQV